MSVQNLRNKFSQNNGTVPYNPPGLSYGKPVHGNNNNSNSGNGNTGNSSNSGGSGGSVGKLHNGFGTGRFKTIREEPADDAEKPPIKNNNSFLQSYLSADGRGGSVRRANGTAPAAGKTGGVPAQSCSNRFIDKTSAAAPAVRSPPPTGSAVKPPPLPPVVNKFATKPPPPLPPSQPADSPARFAVVNGTGDGNKWRTKYDETETKRKTLLTQSQRRECFFFYFSETILLVCAQSPGA